MIYRILSEISKKNFINMYGGGVNMFSNTIPTLHKNNTINNNDQYKLVLKKVSYFKGTKYINGNRVGDIEFTKDSLKKEIGDLEKFNVRVFYGNDAAVVTYEK